MMLECEHICKTINKKQILKDITFSVEEGDILGFIGPNGAGKTTTIKLILGLQKITSGTIKINGYNIKNDFVKAIENVGAIVENPDLYMYLTGEENLKYLSLLYKNITKDRINEVVKLVKLENRIKDKVSTYSLGMRQRLGIAQALLHKPKLLILDEPTNGLDPEGIIELRELLKDLVKKEKMSIMISSHNLAEIENCCNKVCIIQHGEIIQTTTIEKIKKENDSSVYIFELNNVENLKNMTFKYTYIDNYHIEIMTKKDIIPDIINELISKNIKIFEISKKRESLEEIFIKKIGGNEIV